MRSWFGMYSCGSVMVNSQERGAGALAVDGSVPTADIHPSMQSHCWYCNDQKTRQQTTVSRLHNPSTTTFLIVKLQQSAALEARAT